MPIRAVGGLGHSANEALQRHVERLLLDTGRLGGKAQLLQSLDADPDLVGRLAERAAERANAGAQQLRLAPESLEPA
jgi:hypothetical protein